jgi:hypothetical protein
MVEKDMRGVSGLNVSAAGLGHNTTGLQMRNLDDSCDWYSIASFARIDGDALCDF